MYFSKTSVALYNVVQPVRTVGYFGGVYRGRGWEMVGSDKDIRGSVLEILLVSYSDGNPMGSKARKAKNPIGCLADRCKSGVPIDMVWWNRVTENNLQVKIILLDIF